MCVCVCVSQAPSSGSDVNKRMSVFLRRLADALERDDLQLCSSAMKRDFISHRLPPYLLEPAELEPGESHRPAVCRCTASVIDDCVLLQPGDRRRWRTPSASASKSIFF